MMVQRLYMSFGCIVNFAPNEAANYKVEEREYVDPNTEFDDSDVDNKLMEVESDICISDDEGEMMNLYEEKEFQMQEIDSSMDPYVGMEFDSEEAAMEYYNAYANRVGFIMRIGNCHRSSHGLVTSRRFLCNKEGFRVNKNVQRLEVRKPRAVTREGCKAMVMVRKGKSGTWVVAKVETHHNHPLGVSPRKARRGSVRLSPQDEKDKKIHELSTELHHTKQQLAKCQKQLDAVLNNVELHMDHLTTSVQHIVQSVKDVEDEYISF